MPIELDRLAQNIDPSKTVLFFGAGSSIPSGSPTSAELTKKIREKYQIEDDTLSLAEASELAEINTDRADLISFIRSLFPRPEPTGGLLNIPLYTWRGIYTTNYDEIIERSYVRRSVQYYRVTTNFDFSKSRTPNSQPIYKIHGTIGQDVSDGSKGRMILTLSDYDKALDYREFIYNQLAADLAGSSAIIIGYSLTDPDIKYVIDKLLSIQAKMDGMGGQIYLLLYQKDENRAKLFEARNVRVAFGGIDEFSEALARRGPAAMAAFTASGDPVQDSKILSATSIDITHARSSLKPNASSMFNGWPATYADIANEMTFLRTMTNTVSGLYQKSATQFVTIIGASGVGKTTTARQIAIRLDDEGWRCWEHKGDFALPVSEWVAVARWLEKEQRDGLLVVDDANFHLNALNKIADTLAIDGLRRLRVLMVSSRSAWQYRAKSTAITRAGSEQMISKLNSQEIDRLILLSSGNNPIAPLVVSTFSGFSFQEKRSRLIGRCEADAFVCLRNIFATEKFDDIILREYAELDIEDQDIYRLVAAMEHAGIRVHRQLIIRLTGISASRISTILNNLVDIIAEYNISERFGVYGWKVRHSVIAGIIAKYKYSDPSAMLDLFEQVIDNISPTYDVELRTIRELCNVDTGLPSIPDKNVQNKLLRRLISMAPGETVPRHRLIRNLISLDKFELAESEIRVFENELGGDAPVARYKVALMVARALHTPGILPEDRIVILKNADSLAGTTVRRYPDNPRVLGVCGDVGLELLKATGDRDAIDRALKAMKEAEGRTNDDDITRLIRTYERRAYDLALSQ